MVGIRFEVSDEVVFDYLVDPRRRPEWQRSLARVEQVDGEPRVGQAWTDVTWPGPRPRLTTTELDRARRWTEEGRWRSFRGRLTLRFVPDAAGVGCTVSADVELRARGVAAPLAVVLAALAPYAVRADLRRAARVLSRSS